MFRRVLLLAAVAAAVLGSNATGRAATIEERVAQLEADTKALQTTVSDMGVQMREFHGQMLALTKDLSNQNAQLREIVVQIGRQEGSIWVPAVRGNMERSPAFRQEMADVVHQTMPQQGTIRVNNQMGVLCQIRVNNQTTYDVPPFQSVDIRVAVGTVTTELVGYEQPKTWSISPPNYAQVINITPRQAPAVMIVGYDAFGAPVYAAQ